MQMDSFCSIFIKSFVFSGTDLCRKTNMIRESSDDFVHTKLRVR